MSRRGAAPRRRRSPWHGCSGLSPALVAIPGARRPETARSAARAATLGLDPSDRELLTRAFGMSRATRAQPRRATANADVVLVIGIPGAGKSRVAEEYVAVATSVSTATSAEGLCASSPPCSRSSSGPAFRRVVLDNTFLSRAARSYVIEVASRHGIKARCIWLGHLTRSSASQPRRAAALTLRLAPHAGGAQDAARREPGMLLPTSQMRALRELEPPSDRRGICGGRAAAFRAHAGDPASPGWCVRRGRRTQPTRLEAGARAGRSGCPAPDLRLAARRHG